MTAIESPTGQDWTSTLIPEWTRVLVPALRPLPDLSMLEIGCFEGRSGAWFIENLCAIPECRYVGVDTFEGSAEHKGLNLSELENTCRANLARAAGQAPCSVVVDIRKGRSADVLPGLQAHSFDFIYVDGSHEYFDVRRDLLQAARLARKGSLILVDDANWPGPGQALFELWHVPYNRKVRQVLFKVPGVRYGTA